MKWRRTAKRALPSPHQPAPMMTHGSCPNHEGHCHPRPCLQRRIMRTAVQVSIKELLKYFDIKESSDYGDTTAAIAVVGEDLGAALFQHYCKHERGSKALVF